MSKDRKGMSIDNIFFEQLLRTLKYEHNYLHVHEDNLIKIMEEATKRKNVAIINMDYY